jgi:tetratricopeptide (TPR) repeat protein
LPQIIDLCFELRHSCVPLRDHGRALAYLRTASEHAEAIGDRARLGWTYAYRAHGLYLAGNSPAAIEAAEQSLTLATALDDPDLRESASFYRAQLAHWVGDYGRAAKLFRQNVNAVEPELRRRGLRSRHFVGSRTYLGWCLAELGEFSEALARTEEAIATATKADNAYWLVYACFGAGLAHLRRGAFDEARSFSERAVALCAGRDFTALWVIPAAILGLAYARAGRFEEGLRLLTRAADLASTLGAPILNFLAEARLLSGHDEEAAAAATRARELASQREEHGWEAWAWWTLGEIATKRADVSSAADFYRRALTAADALGMRPLVAQCHLGLGRLHRRAGEEPEAIEHLVTAKSMFAEMTMSWWLGEAERERLL